MFRKFIHIFLCLFFLLQVSAGRSDLYEQYGRDSSFETLLKRKGIGVDTSRGVSGSRINVNNRVMESRAHDYSIPKDIRLHTNYHGSIPRKHFDKWTRWYQEDGNTQVFRLFKGERNVRNSREYPGRVETFSELEWQRGEWHEWEGSFTIVKPHTASIFQVKANEHAWSVMINLTPNGDIRLNHRRNNEDKVLARNMTGRSFRLKVRDNGHDYEVYFNGRFVGSGHFARPGDSTKFRWGLYVASNSGKEMASDAMIFVSDVKFK